MFLFLFVCLLFGAGVVESANRIRRGTIIIYYIKYITDVLRLVDDTSRGIPFFFIILTSP